MSEIIYPQQDKNTKLTAENVDSIFIDCLFAKDELHDNVVIAEGVLTKIGFNPVKLEKHSDEIYNMLKQLPEEFQKESGGGMTFLNAYKDKDGNQWTGLHQTMEQLVTLGIGINKVKYCTPKELWDLLPGGMPYFVVE